MVSHQRLQHYRANYGLLCMTGLLGCRWHRYKQSTRDSRKRDLLSCTVLVVTFIYTLFYFYFWLIAQNDSDDFNWYIYTVLSQWFSWIYLFLALSSAIFAYYFILMCLTLLHVIQGHQLYVYPLHLFVSLVTLATCISTTVILDNLWNSEWQVLKLSLQITGPFLHVGFVCLMTLLTWIIAGQWLQLSHKGLKLVWLLLYISIMVCLYLCPLLIDSPCVISHDTVPPKPAVIGHRGAPVLAPENTLMSFQSAINHGARAIETDVRISYDGVPFILHDPTLRRTTNISSVFPDMAEVECYWFNISQIKMLNAGSWFLQMDPFDSVSSLTDDQRTAVTRQTIPTFEEVVELAAQSGVSVMFDLFPPPSSHPYANHSVDIVVKAIHRTGIPQDKIFWMKNGKLPLGGDNFVLTAGEYKSLDELRIENYSAVNLQYGLEYKTLQYLQSENITVNIYTVNTVWLFSLYWCVGVDYVTSDQCHILENVHQPVWHLSPQNNLILWVTVDAVSAILVVLIFILQRVRLYGTKFNPETLSLQAGRTDSSYEQVYRSKNMKQQLLKNGDQFETSMDQSNSSFNSLNLPVGSYCLHTINGFESPSMGSASNSPNPSLSETR